MTYESIELNAQFLQKEEREAIAGEILTHLKKGMTLQEAIGISDQALEEVYGLAYNFYSQGKYKESVSLFHFLAGASPKTYKYIFGLASSYHELGIYQESMVGFYVALGLEPNNPLPAYYITDAFLKQDLIEEAKEFVEVTISICGDDPEYQNMKHRCELIQQSLKNK
ncbi:MAG: SycD/LcrH family type III secretion system chaperone [Chlamydiales bacterium]